LETVEKRRVGGIDNDFFQDLPTFIPLISPINPGDHFEAPGDHFEVRNLSA
jgi:hypothetical protein